MEDPIARALNRMAEVMEYVMRNTRRMEPKSINKKDRALERFLKFYPPQYYGKPDTALGSEKNWIDQMENILQCGIMRI
jgi:hypothetical protein